MEVLRLGKGREREKILGIEPSHIPFFGVFGVFAFVIFRMGVGSEIDS
jgi:hypothetical protein